MSETGTSNSGSVSDSAPVDDTSGDEAFIRPDATPVDESVATSGAGQVGSSLQRELPGEEIAMEKAAPPSADERRGLAEKAARDLVHALGLGEEVARHAVAAAGNIAQHVRQLFDLGQVVNKAVADTSGTRFEMLASLQQEQAQQQRRLACADVCPGNLSSLSGFVPFQRQPQPQLSYALSV